ncbi:MAG TPA: hypothetical protein VGD26_09405 [Chitinophagaceae bacterium]
MEKINEYLDKYIPQVTKLGSSGLYKVWSPGIGDIATIGRAGVSRLKDELLFRGLKINIQEGVEERTTSNTESGSH